jgi:glycine oxidase
MKVIVVGAGIAGMAIGWRLAQTGAHVEIFERGLAGRGATWAAAGMIIPGGELEEESADLARFARRSRELWPGFAAELESESGCTIDYSEPGSLLVALDETRARALEQRAARIAASSVKAEWVARKELRNREPLLSSALHGALHILEDARVDNRLAGEALRVALSKRNVAVHENTEVTGLTIIDGRVRGIVCDGRPIAGDATIAASGAWMNELHGTAGVLPPMKPAKGQMICVRPPRGTMLPRPLLGSDDVYIVPRGDRILIGATVEDAGFDTSVSRQACMGLLSAAARIIPDIGVWGVSEIWAGLRPRTPDGAPVLGETALPGLLVASGQYRNGILFAPAVADAMSRIVLSGQVSSEIRAFDPRRFASS